MDPSSPQRVGSYTLLEQLGTGGQGTVWLAEDERLHRRVALKLLHAAHGSLSSQQLARFRREAEAASKLDHPNICALLDAGEADGVAYLAFRYVAGTSLAQRIAHALMRRSDLAVPHDEAPTDAGSTDPGSRDGIQRVVALFEKLARALHKAHEHGLIHRDVKPGNVMITPDGEPVLLDFGLARDELAGQETLTHSGDLLGTPAYMSPEQLMAHRVPLDRRTDVFSLGATLYESLTLQRPFSAATRAELYQRILHSDPASAGSLNRQIPRDLQVVLQTAMEKDRNRRYQSAQDLADDLRRFLHFEPIRARPIGRLLRLRRWAQRHPAAAVTIVALAALLVVTLGFVWQQRNTLTHTRALALASASAQAADSDQMLALILARRAVDLERTPETMAALHEALANATESVRIPHDAAVNTARWSPDGTRILTACLDGTARFWTAQGKPVGDPLEHDGIVRSAEFSPSGESVLTACEDGFIYVWDAHGGCSMKLRDAERPTGIVSGAAYALDGRWIVSQHVGTTERVVRIWRADTGALLHRFATTADLSDAALTPDGSTLVLTTAAGQVQFRDWENDRELRAPIDVGPARAKLINFGRNGDLLLITSNDGVVRGWGQDGSLEFQTAQIGGDISQIDMRSDGWSVMGSADRVTRLFDPLGKLMATYRGHSLHAFTAYFSPDGPKILTGSPDRTARVWDVCVPDVPVLRGHRHLIRSIEFLPETYRVVTASDDRTVRLWTAGGGFDRLLFDALPHAASAMSVSATGKRVAIACMWTCRVAGLDEAAREVVLRHSGFVSSVCFSPTAENVVATACMDKKVRLWNVDSRQVIREFAVTTGRDDAPDLVRGPQHVAFSPDGRTLAVCWIGVEGHWRGYGPAELWNVEADPAQREAAFGDGVSSVSFSSDGRELLTAQSDGTAQRWDVTTAAPIGKPIRHESQVMVAEFSPDGHRIVTVSRGRVARLWSGDGKLQAELRGHQGLVWDAVFSSDGKRIATTSWDRTARVWIVDEDELIGAAKARQLPVRADQLVPYAELIGEDVTADW